MKNDFLNHVLTDLKVELLDEFDLNFERKSFFGSPWKDVKYPSKGGSILMRSGNLRRSLRAPIVGDSITFYSSLPYAAIHNEGGMITVTQKMKRYFWAMYYKASGAVTYNVKTRKAAKTARNTRLSTEAQFFKAMALKKVGSKIKIDQRQFIGPHRQVDLCVERVLEKNLKYLQEYIYQLFKP